MSTTSIDETQTTPHGTGPAAAAPLAVTAPVPALVDAPAAPTDPDVTTFRGRTLEELLPQIREQLGPDAVVVRQRDGLMGGIGGFFQQRFVEVAARAGHARIDVYDEPPPPTPDSFAALLADAESDGEADAIVTATTPAVGDSQPLTLPAERGPRVAVAPTDPDPRSSAEPASPAAQTPPPEPSPSLPKLRWRRR